MKEYPTTTGSNSTIPFVKIAYANAMAGYVSTAIHEMLHRAGYYFNDFVLAQAVTDLGEKTQQTIPTNSLKGGLSVASDVFNTGLMNHCGE